MTDVTSGTADAAVVDRGAVADRVAEVVGGDDLGRLLDALKRSFMRHAHDAFADVPSGARGVRVMQVADSGVCANQASIAAALGIDRTVMTYLVDDLEQAGLVTRRPDPADRRARQVVVTPAGQTVLERVGGVIADVERQTLAALSAAETAQLRSLLERAASGLHSSESCAGAPGVSAEDSCVVGPDAPSC